MQANLTTTTTDHPTLARLTARRDPMVGNNTALVGLRGGSVAYCLHNTNIVTVHPDGMIELNTGGHWTTTTKSRMNTILGHLGVRIYSVNYVWRIRTADGTEHDYLDGMTLDAVGNLV